MHPLNMEQDVCSDYVFDLKPHLIFAHVRFKVIIRMHPLNMELEVCSDYVLDF